MLLCLQSGAETAGQSLSDSDPSTPSEPADNEISGSQQDPPSALSEAASSVEPKAKKKKIQDDVPETLTGPQQQQNDVSVCVCAW